MHVNKFLVLNRTGFLHAGHSGPLIICMTSCYIFKVMRSQKGEVFWTDSLQYDIIKGLDLVTNILNQSLIRKLKESKLADDEIKIQMYSLID